MNSHSFSSSSPWRDPAVVEPGGRRLIVICDEGYQSSLAAATLLEFGFTDAGDVIDGFQAWRQAGLPVLAPPHPSSALTLVKGKIPLC